LNTFLECNNDLCHPLQTFIAFGRMGSKSEVVHQFLGNELIGEDSTSDQQAQTEYFQHIGCIEGFSEAENCKEHIVESINTISLF